MVDIKMAGDYSEAQHERSKNQERKQWSMGDFIHKTPCVRSSLMTGIISGLTVGFGSFIYSKRIKRSCDIAVGAFTITSLASWCYCYYNRWTQVQKLDEIIAAMKKSNLKREETSSNPNLKSD